MSSALSALRVEAAAAGPSSYASRQHRPAAQRGWVGKARERGERAHRLLTVSMAKGGRHVPDQHEIARVSAERVFTALQEQLEINEANHERLSGQRKVSWSPHATMVLAGSVGSVGHSSARRSSSSS